MPQVAPYHGSCLCKAVEFEVIAEPLLVSCCHCSNCKKFTGTVFQANVVFPPGSTRITKGQSIVQAYRDGTQDSGNALQRVFCGKCGSPLYCTGSDAGRMPSSVFYSALDDFKTEGPSGPPPPEVEFYSKDRVHWVHAIDGAEQPKTKPGKEWIESRFGIAVE